MTEERLLLVSGDGHVSPPLAAYRPYLGSRFHDALEALEEESAEYLSNAAAPFSPSPASLAIYDRRGAVGSGGETGAYDLDRRLAELDAEGVAGEIVHWGAQFACMPFFDIANRSHPAPLRQAGARAYNRWLADWMEPSNGRLAGVLQPGTGYDLEEAVGELRWAATHGFAAVQVPGGTGDPALPNLFDPRWEPFWATAAEVGLALSVHAGWGQIQGQAFEFFKTFKSMGMTDIDMDEFLKKTADSPLTLDIGPRRVVWQLMLAGVFDRHPSLQLVLTEVRADWVPSTLAYLDRRFETTSTPLARRPSEYFASNCAVTPSSPHRAELAMRHEIGVGRFMFGVDYPHIESTWPNTHDWIRDAFADVPEEEARRILGENAVEIYGLDRAELTRTAARIGPTAKEVLGAGHEIDAALVDHFHRRAGYLRPAEEVDGSSYEEALRADLDLAAR